MRRGAARWNPVHVPADEVLSETVVFELLDGVGAERLWERLRPRWFTSVYKHNGGGLVAVDLRPEEGDLATLLRTVQFWGRGSGFHSIQFHVDGRAYVLNARTAIWPAAVA
jgi:hypothetical protein